MADQYVSNINGFLVKDKEARAKAVDRIKSFNFASGDNGNVYADENGILWDNDETEIEMQDGNYLYVGTSSHRLPLVAGNNITFEKDEDNKVVRINASGGSGDSGSQVTIELDTTLTQAGKAADAEAVGDKIAELVTAIATLNEEIQNLKNQLPDGGDSYQTFELSIQDNDFCGPYEVTYKAYENGNLVDKTAVVSDGNTITITALLGTILYISTDNSASYSGSTLHDENDTRVGSFDWNETEIQLPSNGTSYHLYLYG